MKSRKEKKARKEEKERKEINDGGKGARKGKNQEQGKEGKGPGELKEEKMYKVSKFVQCGYVWEFNSDTQEYTCFSK